MKKKYIKPAMQVYEVRKQHLLIGSPDINGIPGDGNGDMY